MKLGIDASNIRAGGGITHLGAILDAARPLAFGIDEVFVWSSEKTLGMLPTKPWLRALHESALDGGLVRRTAWRYFKLGRRLKDQDIDVLLVPGGVYTGGFRPFVAVAQNLLPFEDGERQRFGRSPMRLRIELLRRAQFKTFHAANGLIFNTHKARQIIESQMDRPGTGVATAIPFGVDRRFRMEPRPQKTVSEYSFERPFRWLYVSTINLYKHQWNVVAAVATLRREGMPVALDLVGSAYPPAEQRLLVSMARWDPQGDLVRFHGPIPPSEVAKTYRTADAAVFASTCETPSFVVLESMAGGLPIACAKRSAMPEILGTAAHYFDPEDPDSIADAMRQMLQFPERRRELATKAFHRALDYTWDQCADDTMAFVAAVGAGTATGTSL